MYPSGGPPVKPVMDLLSYCCLLEDLMEIGTIADCEELFACIEADIEVWGVEPDIHVQAHYHHGTDPMETSVTGPHGLLSLRVAVPGE